MPLPIDQYRFLIHAAGDAVKNPHARGAQFGLFQAACIVFGADEFSRYMDRVSKHLERPPGEPRNNELLDTVMGQTSLLMLAVFAAAHADPDFPTSTLIMAMINLVRTLGEDSGMPTPDFLRAINPDSWEAVERLLSEGAPKNVPLH